MNTTIAALPTSAGTFAVFDYIEACSLSQNTAQPRHREPQAAPRRPTSSISASSSFSDIGAWDDCDEHRVDEVHLDEHETVQSSRVATDKSAIDDAVEGVASSQAPPNSAVNFECPEAVAADCCIAPVPAPNTYRAENATVSPPTRFTIDAPAMILLKAHIAELQRDESYARTLNVLAEEDARVRLEEAWCWSIRDIEVALAANAEKERQEVLALARELDDASRQRFREQALERQKRDDCRRDEETADDAAIAAALYHYDLEEQELERREGACASTSHGNRSGKGASKHNGKGQKKCGRTSNEGCRTACEGRVEPFAAHRR